MKTPEKTKKGLECCGKKSTSCDGCPYEIEFSAECLDDMHEDALAMIQQLEEQNAELVRKTEQLKEGASFTLTVKEQDVKGAVKKAYDSFEIDGKKLSEWIKLLADYKRQDWISAKEPPKKWENDDGTFINYLVYMPEYGVDIANYLQPANTWVCLGVQCKVTHWMPLPEPPMEETGHV